MRWSSRDATSSRLPDEVAVVNVGLPLFADAVASPGPAGGPAGLADPGGRRPELVAALTPLSTASRGADRRGQRRGAAPPRHRRAVRGDVGTAGGACPDSAGGRSCTAGPRSPGDAGVRPAAPLDAGRGGRRGLGRRTWRRPTRCSRPAGSGWTPPTARDGRADGDRARPAHAGAGRGQRGGGRGHSPPISQGPGDVAWFGRETDAGDRPAAVPRATSPDPLLARPWRGRARRRLRPRRAGRADGRRRPHAHPGEHQPAHPPPAPAVGRGERPEAVAFARVPVRQTTCSSSTWRWRPRSR